MNPEGKYKIEEDKYGNFSIYEKRLRPSGTHWWAICGSRETYEEAELFINDRINEEK